jgi:hypothetical protein
VKGPAGLDVDRGAVADGSTTVVAESTIEANGFEFEQVPPGEYEIEVLLPDRLIVIASVTLEGPPAPPTTS